MYSFYLYNLKKKKNRNKNNTFLADVHNTAPTQPFFMFHSLNLSQLRETRKVKFRLTEFAALEPQCCISLQSSTCKAAECMGWCGEVWCPCAGCRWGGWELWCPWLCGWWWALCAWLGWWWAWCGYPWGGPCMCWWGWECRWWWPAWSWRDGIISIIWPMEFMLPFAMPPGWWARAAFSLWVQKWGKWYILVSWPCSTLMWTIQKLFLEGVIWWDFKFSFLFYPKRLTIGN